MYFHTLFEGIAIGVQDTLVGFLSTAVAIGFHKWADALSMGIHYRNKNTPPKIASKLILGQAILNVVAICTGCLLSTGGEEVEAIFLSVSAGTFLAISTLELLTHQLNNR
jgi:zinc transporter ZupT